MHLDWNEEMDLVEAQERNIRPREDGSSTDDDLLWSPSGLKSLKLLVQPKSGSSQAAKLPRLGDE